MAIAKFGRATSTKYAPISANTLGDTIVIAALSGFKIRVVDYVFMAKAAVDVIFKSSGGSALTGTYGCSASGGAASGYCPAGHFESLLGEGININLGTDAIIVGGHITYEEHPA